MERTKKGPVLDRARLAAALLVVAIHTSPLSSFSAEGDFFLTRVLARTAVPFFFMVTGQFVLSDSLFSGREGNPLTRYWRLQNSAPTCWKPANWFLCMIRLRHA